MWVLLFNATPRLFRGKNPPSTHNFNGIRDILQDPQRGCAYYLKAEDLSPYEASVDTLARMDDGTVTFVIPDGEIFDEVPPYLRNPEVELYCL